MENEEVLRHKLTTEEALSSAGSCLSGLTTKEAELSFRNYTALGSLNHAIMACKKQGICANELPIMPKSLISERSQRIKT
jgi:hypothetical protein